MLRRSIMIIEILAKIVSRAPEVRNPKKSKIIPPLERIGHLEFLSIYRLPSATDQQFFCLAKAPSLPALGRPQRSPTSSILSERLTSLNKFFAPYAALREKSNP